MVTPQRSCFTAEAVREALAIDEAANDASNTVAFEFLRDKILSRYIAPEKSEDWEAIEAATNADFFARNIRAGNWKLHPDLTQSDTLVRIVNRIKYELWRIAEYAYLGDKTRRKSNGIPVAWHVPEAMKPGPGSTTDTLGTQFATPLEKLLWGKQSVGSRDIYRAYVKLLAQTETKTQKYVGLERARVAACETSIAGQSIIVIPKNERIGRIIMPQNGIDLAVQRDLSYRLTEALKWVFGIDLATQPYKNNKAARKGSVDKSIATLDLRAASHGIVVLLVKWAFDGHPLLEQLMMCRNPMIDVPIRTRKGVEIKKVVMNIYGGMGNDVTFPLQTAIFAAVARACAHWCNCSGAAAFGDDIIVPTEAAELTMQVLTLLGFEVNTEKSFYRTDCDVRESCGGYYQNGKDIAPFRIDGFTSTRQRFTAFNQCIAFQRRTGIRLRALTDLLLGGLPDVNFIPLWEDEGVGIRWPLDEEALKAQLESESPQGIAYFPYMRYEYLEDTQVLVGVPPELANDLASASWWCGFGDSPKGWCAWPLAKRSQLLSIAVIAYGPQKGRSYEVLTDWDQNVETSGLTLMRDGSVDFSVTRKTKMPVSVPREACTTSWNLPPEKVVVLPWLGEIPKPDDPKWYRDDSRWKMDMLSPDVDYAMLL